MRYISLFLLFLCCVLPLSGCDKHDPQGQVIASGTINDDYTMNIVLSEEGSSGSNHKHYTSIVIGQDNMEKSTLDVNSLLNNENLDLNEGALSFFDYNGDGDQELAIGTPDENIDGMYRYAMISIDQFGNQTPLQVEGYNEDGFIYCIDSGDYPSLTTTKNSNGEFEIFVGIREHEKTAPAKYIWTDDRFLFLAEEPYIISREEVPNFPDTYLTIEQTEYLTPSKATDPQFDIYKSYILGQFDAVIYENNVEVSRLNLNGLFSENDIGWAGPFAIIFNDYNDDGLPDFAVGQPVNGSADFKYVILTISKEGTLDRLNATGYKDDGFIYNSNETPEFTKLLSPQIGVSVVLSDGGWAKGTYIWDDTEQAFLFSRS